MKRLLYLLPLLVLPLYWFRYRVTEEGEEALGAC